jgi:hypothetical protein
MPWRTSPGINERWASQRLTVTGLCSHNRPDCRHRKGGSCR